jgi:NAD(P)-dependent dehydrogenase (short-subunit alcohol dehydrogenase family)
VTGASAGLGRHLALDLASAGAVVVGVAGREERLRAVVDEMRRHSPESDYRVCDLSDAASFVGLVGTGGGGTEPDRHPGQIVGVGGIMRTEPTTAATLRSIMEVNFIAPVAGMVTPSYHGCGSGGSVQSPTCVRTTGALRVPEQPTPPRAKAALAAATESLSYEARPDGVPPYGVSRMGAD